jgi:crossover junction endodeoxyribonuclease RusA
MTTELVLIIDGRPMNSNDRRSVFERARLIKAARNLARFTAWDTWGEPRRARHGLEFPVAITIQDQGPRRRDTSNCQPQAKAVIDGLTDYGLWPDDTPTYVGPITFLPFRKAGRDAIVLTITGAPK